MLCDDREGWEEAQEGGDIHTRIADSICCVAETNTHCKAIILWKKKKDASFYFLLNNYFPL